MKQRVVFVLKIILIGSLQLYTSLSFAKPCGDLFKSIEELMREENLTELVKRRDQGVDLTHVIPLDRYTLELSQKIEDLVRDQNLSGLKSLAQDLEQRGMSLVLAASYAPYELHFTEKFSEPKDVGYLFRGGERYRFKYIMGRAIRAGNIELVKFLVEQGFRLDSKYVDPRGFPYDISPATGETKIWEFPLLIATRWRGIDPKFREQILELALKTGVDPVRYQEVIPEFRN